MELVSMNIMFIIINVNAILTMNINDIFIYKNIRL